MGDTKFAICLSVRDASPLKLRNRFQDLSIILHMDGVCPGRYVSHFGGHRLRGPAKGQERYGEILCQTCTDLLVALLLFILCNFLPFHLLCYC